MTHDAFHELYAQARASWPEDIDVPPDAFWQYVRERLEGEELTAAVAADRRLEDLYLACACAAGNERAMGVFGDRFRPAIVHAVAKAAPRPHVDEIVQQVLTKLFVRTAERAPAIASFLGNGKLSTWVQIVARREARTRMRSEDRRSARELPDELEQLAERAIGSEEQVLFGLKEKYRDEFRRAFRDAMERLSPRERNLLRYECVEGLTRDEIAGIYGVSRATVARWRAACRKRLFDTTREAFTARLELPSEEFDSVLRMIESQLHVSLTRLLK